jgi:hypothetical protein
MNELVSKLRTAVHRRMRHQAPATTIGNDGLTDSERLHDLVRFRAGVGSRPRYAGEFQVMTELMRDKLAGDTRTYHSK